MSRPSLYCAATCHLFVPGHKLSHHSPTLDSVTISHRRTFNFLGRSAKRNFPTLERKIKDELSFVPLPGLGIHPPQNSHLIKQRKHFRRWLMHRGDDSSSIRRDRQPPGEKQHFHCRRRIQPLPFVNRHKISHTILQIHSNHRQTVPCS